MKLCITMNFRCILTMKSTPWLMAFVLFFSYSICRLYCVEESVNFTDLEMVAWKTKEAPVDDPIGLGERLALIDYFKEELKQAVKPGTTLEELRVRYWRIHASEERRMNLYKQLVNEYGMEGLDADLSYEIMLKKRAAAEHDRETKRLMEQGGKSAVGKQAEEVTNVLEEEKHESWKKELPGEESSFKDQSYDAVMARHRERMREYEAKKKRFDQEQAKLAQEREAKRRKAEEDRKRRANEIGHHISAADFSIEEVERWRKTPANITLQEGVDERAGIIEYLENRYGKPVWDGVTLVNLRILYWKDIALEKKRLALFNTLSKEHNLTHVTSNMSMEELQAEWRKIIVAKMEEQQQEQRRAHMGMSDSDLKREQQKLDQADDKDVFSVMAPFFKDVTNKSSSLSVLLPKSRWLHSFKRLASIKDFDQVTQEQLTMICRCYVACNFRIFEDLQVIKLSIKVHQGLEYSDAVHVRFALRALCNESGKQYLDKRIYDAASRIGGDVLKELERKSTYFNHLGTVTSAIGASSFEKPMQKWGHSDFSKIQSIPPTRALMLSMVSDLPKAYKAAGGPGAPLNEFKHLAARYFDHTVSQWTSHKEFSDLFSDEFFSAFKNESVPELRDAVFRLRIKSLDEVSFLTANGFNDMSLSKPTPSSRAAKPQGEMGVPPAYAISFLKELPPKQADKWAQSKNPFVFLGVLTHAIKKNGSFDAALESLGMQQQRMDALKLMWQSGMSRSLPMELVSQAFAQAPAGPNGKLVNRIRSLSMATDEAEVRQTIKDVLASGKQFGDPLCMSLLNLGERLSRYKDIDGFSDYISSLFGKRLNQEMLLKVAVRVGCDPDVLNPIFDSYFQKGSKHTWQAFYNEYLLFDYSDKAISRVREHLGPKEASPATPFYYWLLDVKQGTFNAIMPVEAIKTVLASVPNVYAVFEFMHTNRAEFAKVEQDLLDWSMLQSLPLTARRFELYALLDTLLAIQLHKK